MDLSGQTVLVTGANRGIGRAIVEELAERDVHILAGMRDPADFELVSGNGLREARPGAAVYSATKAAVAGFSEALRCELEESPVTVLQLVTPGVETDMLEEVREAYEPHIADPSKLDGVEPREWAAKIVAAIESDDALLNPTGAERLAKIASRGPAGLLDKALARAFDR